MTTLHLGDCLDVLATLDTGSVDAVVTDPPAGIGFMGKAWDHHRGGRDAWIAWLASRLAQARRVVVPGGWLLCWALPRTSHWTAFAIEDAGWTIRDRVSHLFGTGFPKSKSCLKPGCEDWWLCKAPGKLLPLEIEAGKIGYASDADLEATQSGVARMATSPERSKPGANKHEGWQRPWMQGKSTVNPATVTAAGRWPANVCLSHHEDCREVGTRRVEGTRYGRVGPRKIAVAGAPGVSLGRECGYADPDGLETIQAFDCHPDCPVRMLGEQAGQTRPGWFSNKARRGLGYMGAESEAVGSGSTPIGDSGTAARFYYTAKASKADRGEGNTHPTVKSTDLMRWLCRLITPEGGTVLDPFMGSGSTGVACVREGLGFVGIEDDSEPGSFAMATARIAAARAETPLFDGMTA